MQTERKKQLVCIWEQEREIEREREPELSEDSYTLHNQWCWTHFSPTYRLWNLVKYASFVRPRFGELLRNCLP
jgi:hypothetical protein